MSNGYLPFQPLLPHRDMKISRRKALVLAGIALLAISPFLVTTSSFQQWLLRQAETQARKAGFPFTASRLRVDFLALKLSLDGVSYSQDGQRIQVEHLNIDFPWNALRDGIRITSLEADGVFVDIRSTESPSAPGAPAAGSPPPRIQIDQLNIRNAALSYTTPTTVIRIPSLSLEASDGRGALRLDQPVSIGPETNVAVAELGFVLADNSVRFGPATWRIDYAKYDASGSAQGVIRWSPALALETEITTDPITIEKWKDIRVSGMASYADGVLDVSEFRAVQGSGNVAGSARISNAGTSADISWKDVDLNPSGVSGRSDGMLNLKWQAADLHDLTAEGNARLNSRQYGTLQTTVQIADKNASFDIRANAMDLAIRARLTTRLDQVLAGSFKELRANVNGTIRPLSSAVYERVGTVNISANGAFRDNLLTVRDIRARSKGSDVSDVTFQVNLVSRRIRGSVPQVRIALGDLAPDVMGTANLAADINGTIDRPTASFAGTSTGIDIGSTHIDNVRLDGTLANDPAGVRELRGTLSGTVHPLANGGTSDTAGKPLRGFESIEASATGMFRDNIVTVEKIQAESSASNLSDATFQVNLNDKRIQGRIPQILIDLSAISPEILGATNLAADIEGTIDQPTATFTGFSSGVDIGSNHIDSIDLEGTFANNDLRVIRLEAHQADGVLNASGHANLTTEQLDAVFDVSNLKVIPAADLSATVFANGQVGGTYRSPAIDFSGELRDVVYQHEPHGTIRVEGETNLAIVTVRANSDKYSASVTGEVDLKPPYSFTAGLASANSQIHYGKYDLVAGGGVRASGQAQPFKAEHLQFEDFEVRTQGVELSVDGSMDTGTRVDLKVDLPKLPIEGIELNGTARALATLSGTLNDPSIEGTLITEGVKVRAMEMSEAADVSAQVDFTGHDFSLRDVHASLAGATATITGHGSWTGASQLQFRVVNLRPEKFVPDRPVSGVAGIEGEIDFKTLSLDGISGSARVTDLDLKIRDMAIHQTQPIEAEFRNQVLTVRNFEIEGLDTRAKVTGYANLIERTLNFDADANTDLAILEPFIPNAHPDGRVNTRIALRGTLDKPDFDGFINVSGGELGIDRPDILLSEVDAEAQFRGNRIEINHASGLFNGGRFEATGGTGIAAAGLQDAALRFTVERGQLDYPEGLQSEFSSQLAVDGSMPTLTVTGSIDVLNAIYQKNFNLTQQLFARITSQAQGVNAAKATISDQIRMEVEVRTPGPITVRNNVADLEALGSFRIRGTAANPIILGRADVQDGGELYFGPAVSQTLETTQRSDRYTIERGSIDFNNPLQTEPNLDFLATHELNVEDDRYLIRLEVTGTPTTLKAELTSDPYLAQADIVTMLLTGRKIEELQGTYASVAGEQALGYVSGQLSERVLKEAGNVLGLDTIRIDPVTVANQADLAARLTIAKEITKGFSFIYSQNLSSAEAQTWIAAYKPRPNMVLRAINDSDQNEFIIDMKHDLRLGGGTTLPKRTQPRDESRLRTITFTGTHFPEKDLRKQVTKKGSPYGPYRGNLDVRNLRRFLASEGFPAARIETQQNTDDRDVDVHFQIMEGPKVELEYTGSKVPKELQAEIKQAVRPSDAVSLRVATDHLLRHFRSEGYLQVKVSAMNESSNSDNRRYVFGIDPGYKFESPTWVFNGVEAMPINDAAGQVMEKPEAIKDYIEAQLRNNGYLDAVSTVPTLVINGNKAHFEVTVDRGKQYTVENIEFEGNSTLDSERLRNILKDSKQSEESPVPFTAAWLDTARQKITSEYWRLGFNDVQIVPSTNSDSKLARTAIRFAISEGAPQMIERIEITGATRTNRGYIERQFEFKTGDPVDLTKVNLTRKKLYDTRAFTRVEIEMVPGTSGYIARVHLTENAPWRMTYGVAVTEHLQSSERQLGFTTELSNTNLLGRGITLGTSGKVNADERDVRVFGSSPEFFGRRVTTSLNVFRTQDLSDSSELVDYWGGTIQQQWKLRNNYLLTYDYSYKRVRTIANFEGDSLLEDLPRIPIARFNVSISRDSRDDILNATRGTFVSNSFEFAPKGIGSSIEFLRNFSQYFRYYPVKNFVLASGVRVGFVWAYHGQELDPTLQFKAGGGTTVRGFKQDQLTTDPGNYELILNQELRFPLFWKFSGVAFMDAGQTAVRAKDFFNLRFSPGVGIRIQTPFILLRTDLGINAWPRRGPDGQLEQRGRWTFGIGQAF